jgi:hypothetical protein
MKIILCFLVFGLTKLKTHEEIGLPGKENRKLYTQGK